MWHFSCNPLSVLAFRTAATLVLVSLLSGCSAGDANEADGAESAALNSRWGRRQTANVDYVAVGSAFSFAFPTRLVIAMHGCGHKAADFASWALEPSLGGALADSITISLDGASGPNDCWTLADEPKVLQAIDDASEQFNVDPARVVLAGYSSGGLLALATALHYPWRFAGVVVENTGLHAANYARYGAIENPDRACELVEGAVGRFPIVHHARTEDAAFPIEQVRQDWARLRAAGFALETIEQHGNHNSDGAVWRKHLLPKIRDWRAPFVFGRST